MSRARKAKEARVSDKYRSKDALRSLSGATVASVLLIDFAGLGAVAWAWLRSDTPRLHHWVLFALLTALALAHMALTRPSEERRRAVRQERALVEYVDQNGIWSAAAALVLPTTMAIALVLIVRSRRFFTARKPLGLWTSTTATVVLAVVAAGSVRDLLDAATWLGQTPVVFDTGAGLRALAVMSGAVVVYFLAEAVPIGIYRGIRWGKWSLLYTIGSRDDNKLILHTLLLGMAVALVAVVLPPPALLGMLAIAVFDTRNVGRIAALETESARHKTAAITDARTGLLNRRGFDALAAAAVDIDHANGQPTAMLEIDIDKFKGWNSRIGHPGGDKVLAAVADVLRRDTRTGDILARTGGEEMAVVLPGTDWTTALDVAERIRRSVQNLETEVVNPAGGNTLRLGHDPLPPCTISIGIAASPEQGTTITALERYADQALEVAKRNGRNQVVALAMLVPDAGDQLLCSPAPQDRAGAAGDQTAERMPVPQ
ncbi:GGDEF domain-containing protein [Amycolatopsis rubida]|uniref:GGDEF domain-containing protein n=1 Tax=Amycolatopsis rubida TaxID=112413 RepID=UPI00142F2F4D|nr:GGDEF domain-containing protein [Amycolatopsis rubida]